MKKQMMLKSILALGGAVLVAAGARATDYTWSGGASGNWTAAANWTPGTGYPNGANDKAIFASDLAIAVTLGAGESATVKGIVASGGGAVTISGEGALALGADGLQSTAATTNATLEIGVPLAISAAKTVISNATAAVHLKGVVSGEGGVLKGGAGRLYLYSANTFSGGLEATGTETTPYGNRLNVSGTASSDGNTWIYYSDPGDSSGVVIYDVNALGTGAAVFDPGYKSRDNSSGARLTILNCSGEIPNDITIGNDKWKTATSNRDTIGMTIAGGDVTFTGTIDGQFRTHIDLVTANVVRFSNTVKHPNYMILDPSVNGAKFYLDAPIEQSCLFNSYSTKVTNGCVYLCAEATDVNVNLFIGSGRTVLNGVNRLPKNLGYDFGWQARDAVLDLNGYDQEITCWKYHNWGKSSTTAQITSPADRPAQIFCRSASDNDFSCTFTGAAGFVWNPSTSAGVPQNNTLCVSNSVSTTCGAIGITNGTVRIMKGAGFSGLSLLSVESGATLKIDEDADVFKVADVAAAEGAAFDVASGKTILATRLTVGGVAVADGTTITKSSCPEGLTFTGDGSLYVSGEGTPISWTGASGGRWGDAANWSLGKVPDESNDVTLGAACTIVVDEAMANVHALYVGDGSAAVTLQSTGWNSTIRASMLVVANGATITCGAAATNETDLSRIHIECRNLQVLSGGRINADGCGWAGGRWENTHDSVTKHVIQNAGYGPGAGNGSGYAGATHGGLGASYTYYWPGVAPTYGDAARPVTAGSGGALPIGYGGTTIGNFIYGRAGGGVVRIEATGDVCVDGTVSADGQSVTSFYRDTAAAGGSVWITCRSISGSGEVTARGGGGYDPRVPMMHYRNSGKNANDADIRYSPAGGGGRIAIDYDADAQAAAGATSLLVSAAGGEYLVGGLTLATRDNEETASEPGTLHFTDETLVRQLFGKGLSGRVSGLKSLAYEGDLDFTRGFFAPMEEGFTLTVGGNLTIAGEEARLEVGGVCLTNRAPHASVWAGRSLNKLTVGGNMTVKEGGSFVIRAAETNETMRWGGEVSVAGALTVETNGCVYAASDGINLGAPRFDVGSLTVAQGGVVSASRRGGLGADCKSGYVKDQKGFGPGAGYREASAAHGGAGAVGVDEGSSATAVYGIAGATYDDEWLPTMPGSGGGAYNDGNYGDAGTGGGVVYVVASGAIRIDGEVTADGWCGAFFSAAYQHKVGAGSGGTVFLCGETVSGGETALVTAKGGAAMQARGSVWQATGGGGRIAIWEGGSHFASGRYSRQRHNVRPAALGGTVSVAAGEMLYPFYGAVEASDEIVAKVTGQAGTVRYGKFLPKQGIYFVIR